MTRLTRWLALGVGQGSKGNLSPGCRNCELHIQGLYDQEMPKEKQFWGEGGELSQRCWVLDESKTAQVMANRN